MPICIAIKRSSFSFLRILGLFVCLAAFSVSTFAQDRDARDQAVIDDLRIRFDLPSELSDAELKKALQSYLDRREAEYQERKRNETVTVRSAIDSVSVVARCANGYVTGRRIEPDADDVEIARERQVDCDAAACKAVQVDARRSSQAPFSITVSLSCTG